MPALTEDDYSIETLKERQQHLPQFKIRYAERERGWASDLGAGRAIIDNIPFGGRLRYLDVVEVEGAEGDDIPIAGKIVWRAYAGKAFVRYPKEDAERWYQDLRRACKEQGWAIESATAGWCVVCHHADAELGEVFAAAGLDVTKLEIEQAPDND